MKIDWRQPLEKAWMHSLYAIVLVCLTGLGFLWFALSVSEKNPALFWANMVFVFILGFCGGLIDSKISKPVLRLLRLKHRELEITSIPKPNRLLEKYLRWQGVDLRAEFPGAIAEE